MAKSITLEGNELALAIMENAEIGVGEILAHHQDRKVGEGKCSKMTITVVLTPNQGRDRFSTRVTRKVDLAPRNTENYEGRIFVRTTDDGEIAEVSDLDPRQMRLGFDTSER